MLDLILVVLVRVDLFITEALNRKDSKVHLDVIARHWVDCYALQQLDCWTLDELARIERFKVMDESYLARLRDSLLISESTCPE